MKHVYAPFIFLFIAFHAFAGAMFDASSNSNRVERVLYTENKVVKIAGIVNQPFFIDLNTDEAIEDVAGGKIANWEIIKREARLFVRPMPGATVATVLVTTKTRSYVFDFVPVRATPENYASRRSKIVFDYPTTEMPALNVEVAAHAATPATQEDITYCNDNYTMQIVSETVDIRPREAFDDGRFPYFKFPDNIEIPAIYKSVPNTKEEWLVNSHMQGDYVVMHGVSPLWNFRLSGSVIGVYNESHDNEGVAPVNGTSVDGLSRIIK